MVVLSSAEDDDVSVSSDDSLDLASASTAARSHAGCLTFCSSKRDDVFCRTCARCAGLERQSIQNAVLLPFVVGLCILRMTHTCQRLARHFGPQLTSRECISVP